MATIPSMLLPSAFSCDSSQSTHSRLQSTLFASPPASPVTNPHSTLFATCRALQSMLSSPPPQLPTPPMTHAPAPPNPNSFKLRLRSRKAQDSSNSNGSDGASAHNIPRKKIMKRSAPPRGVNKRRREIGDVAGRGCDEASQEQQQQEDGETLDNLTYPQAPEDTEMMAPSTPKRQRLVAPEILPLGLERSDFRTLRLNLQIPPYRHGQSNPEAGQEVDKSLEEPSRRGEDQQQQQVIDDDKKEATDEDDDDDEWTNEEDRILVELVLEKLKLSKSDWQDCARSLGKDRGSVGKRWKSLIIGGEVGLKGRGRGVLTGRDRGRICGTWR